ncbi:MAG: hypothetical protein SGPRY_012964, partial [Prymnesium sp.]
SVRVCIAFGRPSTCTSPQRIAVAETAEEREPYLTILECYIKPSAAEGGGLRGERGEELGSWLERTDTEGAGLAERVHRDAAVGDGGESGREDPGGCGKSARVETATEEVDRQQQRRGSEERAGECGVGGHAAEYMGVK